MDITHRFSTEEECKEMKLNEPRRQRAEGQNPVNRHSTQSERTLTYPLRFKRGTFSTLRARLVQVQVREERRDEGNPVGTTLPTSRV